jgi:F0F1-type ATP synthase assembly protein I
MQKSSSKVEKTTSPSSVFISLALDMSWRLALVVLVPIIGGFELDQQFETAPLLTIIGFLLAMGGMALIMWRTLQVANAQPVPKLTKAQKAKLAAEDKDD